MSIMRWVIGSRHDDCEPFVVSSNMTAIVLAVVAWPGIRKQSWVQYVIDQDTNRVNQENHND